MCHQAGPGHIAASCLLNGLQNVLTLTFVELVALAQQNMDRLASGHKPLNHLLVQIGNAAPSIHNQAPSPPAAPALVGNRLEGHSSGIWSHG
jgi:hypothetical protein